MVRGRVAGDSVADVGPASVMVGNIVQGNRLASAQGRDMGVLDEDSDNAKKVRLCQKLFLLFNPFATPVVTPLCGSHHAAGIALPNEPLRRNSCICCA